jgi:Major Facilitator Superfamily
MILQWKTKRLRKETGNARLRSALQTLGDPKELFKHSIVRPIKMLFLSPIVFLLSLYMATMYGYLYLMLTTFPRVFETQYGFLNRSIGLTYAGMGVGSLIGAVICGMESDRLVTALAKRNGGTVKPEFRLPVMILGALIVPIGLFLYGWTAQEKLHWILPIISTAFLGVGSVTIFVSHPVSRL